jgi:dienelactone hydrolase
MILVHGGGGKAFSAWAEHWAKRGYAALAMDLSGNGPNGKLPDGGPDQSDAVKFQNFTSGEARDMWTYHAVAAAIRGHSLLAAKPEVDKHKIGLTGISWGGYLTCIIAGLDHRFKVAVPVYGCGFLAENSVWLPTFEKMSPEMRERWVSLFDPSQYLGGVSCPILFLNGSNDFAYPMDSYQKSYRRVRGPVSLALKVRLPHGHIWTFQEVDVFIDSQLKGGEPVPTMGEMKVDKNVISAQLRAQSPIAKAEFNYTTDSGPWQKREWKTGAALIKDGVVSATLPAERPLVCFLSVTDARDVTISSPHIELQ